MKAGYGCKIKPCTEKREEDELKMDGIGWKIYGVVLAFIFVIAFNAVPLS